MHKEKVVDLKTYRDEDSEEQAESLAPGTSLMFGQYTIQGYINCGGFGITYLAEDSLKRKVAIKECFPTELCYRAGSEMRSRSPKWKDELSRIVEHFICEAQRLASLKHKHIVHVHQVFEENATAYIVMDYVDGPDLLDIAETPGANLTPQSVLILTERILAALQYVHDNGLLHRDVSPDNILVSRKGEPVLIDFGAAQQVVDDTMRRPSRLKFVKDGYSPHEFYVPGSEQGPSSDLYSFAASLYHLLSGEPPAEAPRRVAAAAGGKPDPYDPLLGRIEGFAPEFLESIDSALAVLPENRIQTASDWLERIASEPDAALAPDAGIVRFPAMTERFHSLVGSVKTHRAMIAGVAAASVSAFSLVFVGLSVINSDTQAVLAEAPKVEMAEAVDFSGDVGLTTSSDMTILAQPRAPVEMTLPLLPTALLTGHEAPDVVAKSPAPGRPATTADLSALVARPDFANPRRAPIVISGMPLVEVFETATPVALNAPLPELAPTVLSPAFAAPSLEASDAPAVSPAEGQPGGTPAIALPNIEADVLALGSATAPPLGDILANQVQSSRWVVDLPFESVLEKVRNAETVRITKVSPAADTVVSADWIKEGAVIYAFNGKRLVPGTPLSEHFLSDLAIDPDGHMRASVRYREADAGSITRGLLAAPILREISLADGTVLEARVVDLSWRLVVVAASEGSGLIEGDWITSEYATGVTFESPDDLARAFEKLLARDREVARFSVTRDGSDMEVEWNLARGS